MWEIDRLGPEEAQLKYYEEVWRGTIESVQALLKHCHAIIDVNHIYNNGDSVLHIACRREDTEMVELLLAQPNINVNLRLRQDRNKLTPLMYACQNRCTRVLCLLLNDPRTDLTLTGSNDFTVLDECVNIGFIEGVELILASGRHIAPCAIFIGLIHGPWAERREARALITRFEAEPELMRHKLRLKLKTPQTFTLQLFAIIVFLCEGLLNFKSGHTENLDLEACRFIGMAVRLPMELQMILCNRVYGLAADNIRSKDLEVAFRHQAAQETG